MKLKSSFLVALTLASLAAGAHAFDISNGVEFTANPLTKANNTPLQAGEFTLKIGYFNFDPSFATNNAAIVANQANLSALNANFVTLFNFDAAQQAEGDQGALSTSGLIDPNGDVGAIVGGPGLLYAYLLTSDATWNAAPFASFKGKNIYAWVQLTSNPNEQAIFTSTKTFNGGLDPFDATTNFAVQETNLNTQVVVGFDRTATDSNDYQLAVPEPSAAVLALCGAVLLGGARRRRSAQA